jgi:hypothetical protein
MDEYGPALLMTNNHSITVPFAAGTPKKKQAVKQLLDDGLELSACFTTFQSI